jgi:hypothetical protein
MRPFSSKVIAMGSRTCGSWAASWSLKPGLTFHVARAAAGSTGRKRGSSLAASNAVPTVAAGAEGLGLRVVRVSAAKAATPREESAAERINFIEVSGREEPGGGISVTIGNEGPGDNLLSARGKNTARGGVKNHTFAK